MAYALSEFEEAVERVCWSRDELRALSLRSEDLFLDTATCSYPACESWQELEIADEKLRVLQELQQAREDAGVFWQKCQEQGLTPSDRPSASVMAYVQAQGPQKLTDRATHEFLGLEFVEDYQDPDAEFWAGWPDRKEAIGRWVEETVAQSQGMVLPALPAPGAAEGAIMPLSMLKRRRGAGESASSLPPAKHKVVETADLKTKQEQAGIGMMHHRTFLGQRGPHSDSSTLAAPARTSAHKKHNVRED